MRLPLKPGHLAPRAAAGAFILHSGMNKRAADDDAAKGLHEMACRAYPPLRRTDPQSFVRALSAGEIVLGAALVAPVVPPAMAGGSLAAFAAGLLGVYARTPALRRPGSIRPTKQGTPIAKDVWLLGIGLGLVADALSERRRSR